MKTQSPSDVPNDARSNALFHRLRDWWRSRDANEQYLAESADLAELERRMRVLERESSGPPFVTYNH